MPSAAVEYWKSRRHPSRRKALVPLVAAPDSWQGRRLSTTYHCIALPDLPNISPISRYVQLEQNNKSPFPVCGLFTGGRAVTGWTVAVIHLSWDSSSSNRLAEVEDAVWECLPRFIFSTCWTELWKSTQHRRSYSWITGEKQWDVMFDSNNQLKRD